MILYFEDRYARRREIGKPQDIEGARLLIKAFLDAYHYKSYYTREWKDKRGDYWFDVGSHSEFFILTKGE